MDSLERFVSAQARDYGTALAEIRSGHKRSHWMWYIFPQLQGLGMSSTAQYYGIHGIEEAKRFIAHPGLGRNLREISNALLALDTNDPAAVMGWPDNLKLCSCMTLFEAARMSRCSAQCWISSTAAKETASRSKSSDKKYRQPSKKTTAVSKETAVVLYAAIAESYRLV